MKNSKQIQILLVVGILWFNTAYGYQSFRYPDVEVINDSLVPVKSQQYGMIHSKKVKKNYNALEIPFTGTIMIKEDFSTTNYGTIPSNWKDLYSRLPSRNWMVDNKNFLRPVLKNKTGLIAYNIDKNKESVNQSKNLVVQAKFKKTEDDSVFFGIAGRIKDKENFYGILVVSDNKLMIVKIKNQKVLPLTEMVFLERYQYPQEWSLTASFYHDLITGIVMDKNGKIIARVDARDGEFLAGPFGLYCTEFTACKEIVCYQTDDKKRSFNVKKQEIYKDPLYSDYQLIHPVMTHEKLNTDFNSLDKSYDIIIAGAGTGGWAAAVQAARLGRRVLLIEETDWIGGQMVAAGVSSMDESGAQVRERGIYREFHESMVLYYYGMDKDPFQAYYYGRSTQNQQEGGYAPKDVKNILYGFIQNAKNRSGKGCLDLILRTSVQEIFIKDKKITGVKLVHWEGKGFEEKNINCKILVDATEYGDLIPLTGACYRVGNTISDNINFEGAVQDYTYTGVIREYADGIPDHLKLSVPPPNYELYIKSYRNKVLYGDWGLHSGQRNFRTIIAWRGMADIVSPLNGRMNSFRHTLGGLNGGNDYPVSVATLEQIGQRLEDEKEGIYRTLSIIYYLQNELGVPWSFAEEQGYNTAYNKMMMEKRGVVKEMLPYAKYLPQMPYVRESRRIIGEKILVADDLQRWEKARHFSTSIAMGDYFMDLHNTYDSYERDLDNDDFAKGGGPFQIPFEVFIPQSLDGFLPAEKNFSQSRLVSGATRLQPITMLTGQAVGIIASIAVEQNVQPRELDPLVVQLYLLDQGSTLIQRWYVDVPWGTELWKAVQIMCLYNLMDRPGEIDRNQIKDGMEFMTKDYWGTNENISNIEKQEVLKKLVLLFPKVRKYEKQLNELLKKEITRSEVAIQCLKFIKTVSL